MIVGTAGHIDHGKTTLIRALTGVDTDRLKEEKARGISIELGYAYTPMENGEVLGFIDVPGHERLIHTMVAGAGGIDFALLVIAADDGVMPQTREHLAILGLLGIDRGAVVLSKIDRVDAGRRAAVIAEIATLLADTPMHDAPLFAVAATASHDPGVVDLRRHLLREAAQYTARSSDGLFRLAVDRVFSLPGHGTIVAGTVQAGAVQVGDQVSIMPAGYVARVRSIHAQNQPAERGRAGQRCALNLAGIGTEAVHRGAWLADTRAFLPGVRIDVRLERRDGIAPLALTRGLLHVHLGTADRSARLVLLQPTPPQPATAYAQLVFAAPVCATPGDRFILRDSQAARTLGGGTVLDPQAPARRRGSPQRLQRLAAIDQLLAGGGLEPLLQQASLGIEVTELARLCGRAPEHLDLPRGAMRITAGKTQYVFQHEHWSALQAQALAALVQFHQQSPAEAGIEPARLRRLAAPALNDAVWRVVLDQLIEAGALCRNGPWLRLPQHRVVLSENEQVLAQALQAPLLAGGVDPPWPRDLALALGADEAAVRAVLRKSASQGEVFEVVHDLFYARSAIDRLVATVRLLARQHGAVSAAQLRDALGLGRKRTIQILEFFDRIGYTRRVRDTHVVRADSAWSVD